MGGTTLTPVTYIRSSTSVTACVSERCPCCTADKSKDQFFWRYTMCLEQTPERTYCCYATLQFLGLKWTDIIYFIMDCMRKAVMISNYAIIVLRRRSYRPACSRRRINNTSYSYNLQFKQYGLPLAILTATTVAGSVFVMPYANARTTTPNAPWPSFRPVFTNINYLHSRNRNDSLYREATHQVTVY